MSCEQVSEHTSQRLVSRSGATLELHSGSFTAQTPNAINMQTTCPVPHVLIYYDKMGKFACGRQALAEMGRTGAFQGILEWVYRKFIWPDTPQYKRQAYTTSHFASTRYSKEAKILGTFYTILGADDTGPVIISELGWAEMMQNVVKLEVVYDEDLVLEGQERPGKQG